MNFEIIYNSWPARRTLEAGAIATLTGISIKNADMFDYIEAVDTLNHLNDNRLYFLDHYTEEAAKRIEKAHCRSLFILPDDWPTPITVPAILTAHVRHVYSTIVNALYDYNGSYWTAWDSADDHQNGSQSTIMSGVKIAKSATIGTGCLIFPNVVIGPNCRIGNHVLIKSGTIIGQPGFGVFKDPNGQNMHLPHVGGVIIGDYAEIGAQNTICAGTIYPTIVSHHVKTDDHVHIAHNCQVNDNVMIAAHAELSGSVKVGRNAWIGPNVSIINGATIGESAFLGIGANILKSVEAGDKMVGNPAKKIGNILK